MIDGATGRLVRQGAPRVSVAKRSLLHGEAGLATGINGGDAEGDSPPGPDVFTLVVLVGDRELVCADHVDVEVVYFSGHLLPQRHGLGQAGDVHGQVLDGAAFAVLRLARRRNPTKGQRLEQVVGVRGGGQGSPCTWRARCCDCFGEL